MTPHDFVLQFMAHWVRRGDCVFDVGANRGLCVFPLLDLVGSHGAVHAFEPNPELAARLRDGAQNRPLSVVEQGVSDHQGEAEFYLDIREAGGGVASSLEKLNRMHGTDNVRPTNIPLTTLDAYSQELGLSPRLIKIDVEGHELSVFRGAAETINRCRPFLIFEFWETWWDRGVRQIFDYLKHDYALVRLQDGLHVNCWYETNRRAGVVDIGCIPISRPDRNNLRPELLAATAVPHAQANPLPAVA